MIILFYDNNPVKYLHENIRIHFKSMVLSKDIAMELSSVQK